MTQPPTAETRLFRLVLLVGATVNLVFWAIHQRLGPPAADPLWQRLVLSLSCAGIAALTWGPPRVARMAPAAIVALAWAGTIWWLHRVAQAGLAPPFAVGAIIPSAIIGLAFRRPAQHLAYAGFTLAAAAAEFSRIPAPLVSPVLVFFCLAAVLGLMHLQIRTRLRAYDELTASEHLRRVMADQTTDALILIDPARREAVECNGRARFLFEVAPGAPTAALATEVLGDHHAEAARELAATGTFRRRRSWRTASGAEILGELTVIPVRLGRRAAWLLRVADTARLSFSLEGGASPARAGAAPHEAGFRPEELATYRRVLVAGAVVVTGLWFVRRALGLVAADPLWQRVTLSAVCLATAALTAGGERARRAAQWSIYGTAVMGTLWWIGRVAASGLRPDYAVGLLVAPAVIGAGLHRPAHHLGYSLVVLAACAAMFLPLPQPGVSVLFVLVAVGTMLGLMHILLRIRMGAYDDLLASEDLRDALFEQTSDALALVDPIRHEVLHCNGRARSVLGFAEGRAGAAVSRVLLDEPEMRVVNVVTVMKEISDRGAYRRERGMATPEGRAFTGDLSISAVRVAHRQAWLIRVAELV